MNEYVCENCGHRDISNHENCPKCSKTPKNKANNKPKSMSNKEKQKLLEKMENEGFDYTITDYSSDIKDKTFQDLKASYMLAREELAKYIGYEYL